MTIYARSMEQAAIYWPPGTPDGYGGFDDGDPVSVKARWEDRAVLFMDANGEEAQSSSVVYVNQEVIDGGHLLEDDLDVDTASDDELSSARARAREIRGVNKSPSVDGETVLVKAFL